MAQNAFKFSDPGSPVRLALAEAFNGITLSISDRGRGFSTEQITRVGAYMQFDRKMQEQQGLGLGLAITKRLVALHGGTLSIVSEPNTGAIIAAKFPKGKAGIIEEAGTVAIAGVAANAGNGALAAG